MKGLRLKNNIRIAIISVLSIFFSSTCWAATYYIDGSNGNDGNPGTLSSPWRTIGKANSSLQPGDTVYIRQGTYNQSIRPQRSGTEGNYITYTSYNDEEATITGVDRSIYLQGKNYIKIKGLRIINAGSYGWVDLREGGSSYNIIENCYMEGTNGWGGITLNDGANYNKIINNTLIGSSNGPSDTIHLLNDTSYNLIEGNTVTDSKHATISLELGGTVERNVIRNNIISNPQHTCLSIYKGTDYNLIENNTVFDAGSANSGDPGHGLQFGGSYTIIRKNNFINNRMGMTMEAYSSPYQVTDNRVYNNNYYQNRSNAIEDQIVIGTGNIIKNNIFYANNRIGISSTGRITMLNNSDNIVNPEFVNPSNKDYSFQSSSPMIDGGIFLTTTVSSGNGTTMQVDDAFYFYDGWGIPGEAGDIIQLEGQTQRARITNVNYDTNTITVDTSLTWTQGLGVSLPYSGDKPDLGAFESGYNPPDTDSKQCASHSSTACYDNDVYWYDSCGSLEEKSEECGSMICLNNECVTLTPYSNLFEAEIMVLTSPMTTGNDNNASEGQYISPTSGVDSTSPTQEASYAFQLGEAGIYYLWVRMMGLDVNSDALYVGIDTEWDRIYPESTGTYEWVQVETLDKSGNFGFNLSAGNHTLQIGHGEINARADVLFLTNNPNETPPQVIVNPSPLPETKPSSPINLRIEP